MRWLLTAMILILAAPASTRALATAAAEADAAPTAAPGEDEQPLPDQLPPDVLADMKAKAEALARGPSTQWMTMRRLTWGQTQVTVAFSGGDPELYKLIENAAAEWSRDPTAGARQPNIHFNFRTAGGTRYRTWDPAHPSTDPADIRISFRPGGYWSALGRLARGRAADRPTMNFQGFDTKLTPYYNGQNRDAWLASYEHGTVLHEFGHALGLSHEHFHPDCQADLKFDKDPGYVDTGPMRTMPDGTMLRQYQADSAGRSPGVLLYLTGWPNGWSELQARFNMEWSEYLRRTTADADAALNIPDVQADQSTRIDQASIMLYTLKPIYFRTNPHSACEGPEGGARAISAADRSIIRQLYP